MSTLHVFLGYNFDESAKKTGQALAIVNNQLTVINLKTASLWTKIKLFFTRSLEKNKITRFISAQAATLQHEAAKDHDTQVAFEKQCVRFARRFRFCSEAQNIYKLGTSTLHVKILYPEQKEASLGICITRYTTESEIYNQLKSYQGTVTKWNTSFNAPLFDIFKKQIYSGALSGSNEDVAHVKDSQKLQGRSATVTFSELNKEPLRRHFISWIKREGYNAGFSSGHAEGYSEGHERGYEAGHSAGIAEGSTEISYHTGHSRGGRHCRRNR